ncbi:MAG: RluA family pseudouridine synthase [Bdellovibrionales bacterium]
MPLSPPIITLTISEELVGQRLDKALTGLLGAESQGLSRARLQSLIDHKHVLDAGKPVLQASRRVKAGETFTIELPEPEPAGPIAQKMDLKIVFEDKDVIVIDKPAGMVVHPAPGNRDKTLVNALLAHCGESLSGVGGVARPGIVHRLDKDTSGLMVVAKNDMAHQGLAAQFADRSLSRTYHAIIHGVPTPRAGIIDAPIGRHPRDRKKMTVIGKGRVAVTHYKVIEAFGTLASLVECSLETGRTHQIRVHLAHIKHPVLGDPVYGQRGAAKKGIPAFPRQALHAIGLRFAHPRNGKAMTFTSSFPKDMRDLLRNFCL